MNSPALSALVAFANQKPRLQFANYGDRNSYAQEARSIRADLARFNRALSDAMESGTTDADLLAVVDKGGMLTLLPTVTQHGSATNRPMQTETGFRVEYTPGQYFPTEYRKAASFLLERANAAARRRTAPTYDTPATTIAEIKRRNRRAGLHFFEDDRSRYVMAFPGCLIERLDNGPAPFRPIFQKPDGSIAFDYKTSFATAAEARAHAIAFRDANQIPTT